MDLLSTTSDHERIKKMSMSLLNFAPQTGLFLWSLNEIKVKDILM